jgi:hypothetical protein
LWKKQHGAALQLKKKYSEEAILSAIKSKDFDGLLVLGIQNGRGYKVNPLAEKIVAKHQKLLEEKNNKVEVDLNVETEKETLETRSTQGYNTKRNTLNQLRNL